MIDQFSITQDEMDAIEAVVDKRGMADVLMALVSITSEKADHIRENWQDNITSRPWDIAAGKLVKLAARLDI